MPGLRLRICNLSVIHAQQHLDALVDNNPQFVFIERRCAHGELRPNAGITGVRKVRETAPVIEIAANPYVIDTDALQTARSV